MRLIDADLLKRKAVNFCIEDDDILNLIDETPSAYDTDKVVEQLEKRIKDAEKVIVKNPADKLDEIANETSEAFIEAYKDAIEIVKGVEQMSDIELKPCPFCGGRMLEITSMRDLEECGNFEHESCHCEQYEKPGNCGYITIVCNKNKGGCGAASGYYVTEGKAVEAWNRRTSNE